MALPILTFTEGCGGVVAFKTSFCASALAFDSIIAITTLVLGILGLIGPNAYVYIANMPLAAAYGLISVSAGMTLLYLAMAIPECIKHYRKSSPSEKIE